VIDINSWKEGVGYYSIDGISIAASIIQSQHIERKLMKVVDLIGREINSNTKNTTLLYIYDDGSMEKKYIIK